MEAWTRLQRKKWLKKKERKKEKDQILKMKVELVGFTDGLDVGCETKNNHGQCESFESEQPAG